MKKKVLILYYSFSSQSRNILNHIGEGMIEAGIEVHWEQIRLLEPRRFPIGSYFGTIKAMATTFFRKRVAINNIDPEHRCEWDLVILGGPTWSFQPSGPVLSLIDREKNRFFAGKRILPVISCRAYYAWHYRTLKKMLKKSLVHNQPLVFMHTIKEPWCTLGLFLKLAGKMPESGKNWFSRYYPKYGHTRQQLENAYQLGVIIGQRMLTGQDLDTIEFSVPVSLQPDDLIRNN